LINSQHHFWDVPLTSESFHFLPIITIQQFPHRNPEKAIRSAAIFLLFVHRYGRCRLFLYHDWLCLDCLNRSKAKHAFNFFAGFCRSKKINGKIS
jgi:hypothetical protein